jgi:hypothetical protein
MFTLRSATNTLCAVAAVMLGIMAFAPSANAALVTLRISDLRNTSENVYDGIFEFTYEDSTPDTLPDDPFRGYYDNPLTAGRFSWGNRVFELDTSMPNYIGITDNACHCGIDAARFSVKFLESGSNTPYSFYWLHELSTDTDALNVIIGSRAIETYMFLTREDGEPQDVRGYFHAGGQPLTLVPIPASVYLFGSALGLFGVMRRKVS